MGTYFSAPPAETCQPLAKPADLDKDEPDDWISAMQARAVHRAVIIVGDLKTTMMDGHCRWQIERRRSEGCPVANMVRSTLRCPKLAAIVRALAAYLEFRDQQAPLGGSNANALDLDAWIRTTLCFRTEAF